MKCKTDCTCGRHSPTPERGQRISAARKGQALTIGPRPDGLSLDRVDNERGYEPGNVRWATRSEQNLNRRPFDRSR